MKKKFVSLFALFALSVTSVSGAGTAPAMSAIYPYAVYDLDYATGAATYGEYLYSGYATAHDYNDKVQSQIAVIGYPTTNNRPAVKIGNSIGSYIGSQTVADDNGIVYAFILGYKHTTVTEGVLQATSGDLYEASTYIR